MENNSEINDKEEKKGLSFRLISILSFLIFLVGSLLSIGWLSTIYLLFSCLCFSNILSPRSFPVLILYSILVLVAKIIVLILSYTTDIIKSLDSFQKDFIYSLGFELVSKDLVKIILSLTSEVLVLIGLIVFNRLGRNQKEQKRASPKSFFICHLWFWLSITFLAATYLLGISFIYLIVSGKGLLKNSVIVASLSVLGYF